MLTHLAALAGLLGIPAGNILGPLIIWLIKKNEIPFVDDQGKEAVNFHITTLIAGIIAAPLICVAGIGFILLVAVGLAALIFSIIGAVKANGGEANRYPFAIRFIK